MKAGIFFAYHPHFADFFILKRIDETHFGLVEVVLRTLLIGVTVIYDIADCRKVCPRTFSLRAQQTVSASRGAAEGTASFDPFH